MVRALRRVRSVTARRQLRWIVWGTALGSRAVRVRLRAAVRARAARRCSGFEFTRAAARADPAGVRLGDRPLPADGRRGHHQARAGLRGGAGGDRRDLRGAAAAWRARCSCSDAEQRNPVIALLATLVVVLLSRPVKNAIQTGARSRLLPRSLRLPPRAGRLRARPEQRSRSAAAERAAGAPRHRDAARRSHGADARAGVARPTTATSSPSRTPASPTRRRALPRASDVGDAADRRAHAGARRSARRCAGSTRARSSSGARPGSITSCRASRRKGRLR